MTAEAVKKSLKEWIETQHINHPAIAAVPIVLNGEDEDVEIPLIGIIETGSAQIEENGIIMRGVDTIAINVELHTIPREAADYGTTIEDHRQMASDLYNILGASLARDYCDGINGASIFDIRCASPIMEPRDGRRVSIIQLTVIACPI